MQCLEIQASLSSLCVTTFLYTFGKLILVKQHLKYVLLFRKLWFLCTVLVIIKLPFYACTYARTRIRSTPVPVSVPRPYPYPCYARTHIRAMPVPVPVRTCWCVCCVYIRW